MKKTLTIIVLMAITYHVNAQKNFKIGPKAGVNFSSLSNVAKGEMLPGFYLGAVSELKISEKFSFQPELVYSSQGVKNIYSETLNGVTSHHHNHDVMSYIQVPLLAKYYLTKGLSLEVGPQLGVLLDATNKDEVTINGVETKAQRDFKNEVNAFDFGVAAGVAYDITRGLFVNARYNAGLTNVGKSGQYYDGSKNSVMQVGLGYKF
jgi:opacity protein-like surface antigen